MMIQTLTFILLRAESGPEAIVGGMITGIVLVIGGVALRKIKETTAKKKDAEKMR